MFQPDFIGTSYSIQQQIILSIKLYRHIVCEPAISGEGTAPKVVLQFLYGLVGPHKITTSILNLRRNTSCSFCAKVMVMESTSSEWSNTSLSLSGFASTCGLPFVAKANCQEHDPAARYLSTKLSYT
jgi:hypothetical protein